MFEMDRFQGCVRKKAVNGSNRRRNCVRCLAAVAVMVFAASASAASGTAAAVTPGILAGAALLVACSAFFSASELAFYSLHQVRLRGMRESTLMADRLAARLMDHPSNLLTTILMGNCVVNVLLGAVLGARVEEAFQEHLPLPGWISYALAVGTCTGCIVFLGEIIPKIMVVHHSERFARVVAIPIFLIDRLFMPLRSGLLYFVGLLFRVTRFSQVRPGPFMTDEEFLTVLSEGEATGVIEEDERHMIQGIMQFSDVTVKEVLVPRPDMTVLEVEATVGEALEVIRKHDFARIPVYEEDLDHIVGILFAKDLLPKVIRARLEDPIRPLLHKVHFVPETMSCADYLRSAQRLHSHIAIVVDEYGGTEGLVTLHDALREVVGEFVEVGDKELPLYEEVGPGVYRLDGRLPLDDLEQLSGQPVEDEEHTTVAGFLMKQADKVPARGDRIKHGDIVYIVEEMKGKRVSRVRMQLPRERVRGTAL